MPLNLRNEEYYLHELRQAIDQLKARGDLPRYKDADAERGRVIAHFLDRSVQIGEAAFRIPDLPIVLDVLVRVLCEDLITLVWVSSSDRNAAE